MDRDQLTEVVVSAKHGNKKALEEIFSLCRDSVYFLALKTVKNHEDALDIVQETFVAVFQSILKLENPKAFESWLYQITINKCKRFWEKKREILLSNSEEQCFEEIIDTDECFIPQEALDKAETRNMIMSLIDSLPNEQRMSVMLYYYEGLRVEEIATIMECPVNTVKSRLLYGRREIKDGVKKYEMRGDKLYSMGTIPILTLLLEQYAKENTISKEVSAEILTNALKTSSISHTPVVANAFGLLSKAIQEKLLNKLKYLPLKTKIIAGVVTGALVITGIAIPVMGTKDNNYKISDIAPPKGETASSAQTPIGGATGEKRSQTQKINLKQMVYNISGSEDLKLPEYIDIVGGSLDLTNFRHIVFKLLLRNLPDTLMFNKPQVPGDYPEYWWKIIFIMGTGERYEVSTSYFKHLSEAQIESPINKYTQTNIWENAKCLQVVDLSLNTAENYLQISGVMPSEFELSKVSEVYITSGCCVDKDNVLSDESILQDVKE